MRGHWPSDIWKKLREVRYRHGYAAAQLKRSVPLQIRALRQQRRLSQAGLAKLCGLKQGVISRAENPEYGNLSFNTVLKIAKGLDVAFVGRFVSFGSLLEITRNYGAGFDAMSFDEEDQSRVAESSHLDDVGDLSSTYGTPTNQGSRRPVSAGLQAPPIETTYSLSR
jgi:transcriptional regulator with XRE-family HTH domain